MWATKHLHFPSYFPRLEDIIAIPLASAIGVAFGNVTRVHIMTVCTVK